MRNSKTANKARNGRSLNGTLDDSKHQENPKCFVIQPFDQGRFDKRYVDAFEPALARAGVKAYRVDKDPNVEVPIDAIEEGIRRARICLADVTTDNPNVWYELGFAYAASKPVILTCCTERTGALPFDIRHRNVIKYKSESVSDFEKLKQRVTERAKALLEKGIEKQMNGSDPSVPQDRLARREIQLPSLVAHATATPGENESTWKLGNDAKSIGLTKIEIGLAFRGLGRRGLINIVEVEHDDGDYEGAYVTGEGWDWIEKHDDIFEPFDRPIDETLEPDNSDDYIPF
ncbi:MAG: hypothetical protein OXN97_22395 [Bryobacterales bacterium]|nr:hypothetical protein [Bryobacterales bacterium]